MPIILLLSLISIFLSCFSVKSEPIKLLYDETDCFEAVCCKTDSWIDEDKEARQYIVEVGAISDTFVYVGPDGNHSDITSAYYQIDRFFSYEDLSYSPREKENVNIRPLQNRK